MTVIKSYVVKVTAASGSGYLTTVVTDGVTIQGDGSAGSPVAVIANVFDAFGSASAVAVNLSTHTSNTSNPHNVTKSQVGLSNVDNTSDVNKPVSTLQQQAIDDAVGQVSFTPYNVKLPPYNAVGDGVSDDTAAINAAITASSAGDAIIFPSGIYLISSTINVTKALRLIGFNATIKTTTTTINMVTVGADDVIVEGIDFLGTASSAQVSIIIDDHYRFKIRACRFVSVGKGGYVLNTIDTFSSGGFFDCTFNTCTIGIDTGSRGEYLSIIGGLMISCGTGLRLAGGNFIVLGINLNGNGTGINVVAGTNNAHGIIADCNLNHNTTPLKIEDTIYGVTLSGNHIYQGILHLKDCNNIVIDGGDIDVGEYRFEKCYNSVIKNVSFFAGYTNTVYPNYNNTTSDVKWENNISPNASTNVRFDRGGRYGRQAQAGTTLDFGLAEFQYRTLTGNVTITDITNPVLGKTIYLEITPSSFTYTLVDNAQLEGTMSTTDFNFIELTCIDAGYIPKFIGRVTQPGVIPLTRSEDIAWYNGTSNSSISGSTISKISGGSTTFDCSADTNRALNGDGTLEFTANVTNTNSILGLTQSLPTSSVGFTHIRFGIYIVGTNVYKMENGTASGVLTTVAAGNKLRISVVGTAVNYEKDTGGGWVSYNTSALLASTFPLYVDVSIRGQGDSLAGCKLTGTVINRNI